MVLAAQKGPPKNLPSVILLHSFACSLTHSFTHRLPPSHSIHSFIVQLHIQSTHILACSNKFQRPCRPPLLPPPPPPPPPPLPGSDFPCPHPSTTTMLPPLRPLLIPHL